MLIHRSHCSSYQYLTQAWPFSSHDCDCPHCDRLKPAWRVLFLQHTVSKIEFASFGRSVEDNGRACKPGRDLEAVPSDKPIEALGGNSPLLLRVQGVEMQSEIECCLTVADRTTFGREVFVLKFLAKVQVVLLIVFGVVILANEVRDARHKPRAMNEIGVGNEKGIGDAMRWEGGRLTRKHLSAGRRGAFMNHPPTWDPANHQIACLWTATARFLFA